LPFKPTFELHGLTFFKGKKGGIDLVKTYKKANIKRFIREINELPVRDYDFVINDFEPVSAWASFRNKKTCIGLSHQASLLESNVPKPLYKDPLGNFVIKNYAPALFHFGFHFNRYSNTIYTPVIRKEIRYAKRSDDGHYVVYLPSYDNKMLIEILGQVPEADWIVFSAAVSRSKNIHGIKFTPIDGMVFSESLATCRGVLCGAGFETPSEALFLGKKLMVIPMKNQYEQHYNAAALSAMGVPVMKKLDNSKIQKLKDWVGSEYKIEITYPDNTEKIVNRIFEMYVQGLFEIGWPNKLKMIPSKKLL
jgi:uncharacterized protein (TIGR00661 family)